MNESKKKWILDSGSTVHVTTNPANLTNIRSADVIIETQAGERSIHHQGDIGELNDVLLNTEGTLNIISLPSYLKANPEIGVMCTSKGAYTIPMETVRQTEYNEKIATMKDMENMKKTPYRNAIGSLSHLARLTRPDLQFATFYHARYQTDPGSIHWKGIKRIMRCANGTKDYKLSAKRDAPFLWCGCDSDWGNDPDKSRSTSGSLVKVKNIVVLSKSRLQRMTAKSSTEAEIIALCDFVEDVIWIKYLLTDFDIFITPEIFCDNKPAIQTIKRGQLSKGNKHIVRRTHFTKGYVDAGEITLSHIRSEDNESDILTKALPRKTYQRICRNIFDSS